MKASRSDANMTTLQIQLPKRKYHPDGTLPGPGVVFVFGSNESGRHGKGAALVAKNRFGARYGIGVGRTGMSYAIPTKDFTKYLNILPLASVRQYVNGFIAYAMTHPDEAFFVSRIGCGLAGHQDSDIAPLFCGSPENCVFAAEWQAYLEPQNAVLVAETTGAALVPPNRTHRP